MKQLKDLEFVLTERGKFVPHRNVDKLLPYLTERVEEEGVVNLGEVAGELTKRFDCTYPLTSALYTTIRLVSSQAGLKTISICDAVSKCYPDVNELSGFKGCRDTKLLYRDDDALVKYIRSITIKRDIVRVELKQEEGEE